MDDDLQNPPEEVLKLYNHARLGGWDVVYTRYAEKKHEGWRNLGSRFANKVADALLVGLSEATPNCAVLLSFECTIEGMGVDPRNPPLRWEAWDGREWNA